jgi:beta-lactamase regulating signal transducer with metallopeptidase domain
MIWLLEVSVKMSLVLGVGLLAAAALGRSSAAMRHWVIAAAIVCAGSMPVLTVVVPAWAFPREPATTAMLLTDVAIAPSSPSSHTGASPARLASPLNGPVLQRVSGLLMPLWVLGAVVNLVGLFGAMFRLLRLASRAATVRAGTWTELLTPISTALGVTRSVTLLRSDRPAILVTWGLMSPVVLLPCDACDWSEGRVRVVLAHELAHIARADWLVQIGAEVLRCVYWFNPLLWLACARLRHEGERSCDDAVMRVGVESGAYASHLLDLARNFGKHHSAWFPAPAMAGRPSTLERRIRAMLNSRVNRDPITECRRWVSAIALLIVTLPIAAYAQNSFGSVSGVVVDQVDRLVPDVTISLTGGQRSVRHELRTDGDGRFELVGLLPGTYALEATVPGFEPHAATMVVSGQAVERNLKLEIGNIQETIRVTGSPGSTNTEQTVLTLADRRALPICPSASAVGGNIRPPRKLRDVRPAYVGVDGHVRLAALIGSDGAIVDVRVVASDRSELEEPAMAAVRQWEFDETLLNCVPVALRMNVDIEFAQE